MNDTVINYGKKVVASFSLLLFSGIAACSAEDVSKTESMQAVAAASADASRSAEKILTETCGACHNSTRLGRGSAATGEKLSRISEQRKTPEGWSMTIKRMQVAHGVQIKEEEKRALVKYLADSQGLSPAESEGYRYGLERRLNVIEAFRDGEGELAHLGEMCARCHSGARVALQRRSEAEWEHTIHMHLGQWPSLEYQALSRDRDWLDIALTKTVPELTERYGLASETWEKWQQERPEPSSLAGKWGFSGHYPGEGELHGVMTVNVQDDETLTVAIEGKFADGRPFNGEGDALLYNGHEWRANIDIGDTRMRQVFSVIDGKMEGRMFERKHYERGLDVVAVHETANAVLAVQPSYVKVGTEATLHIVGSNMTELPALGSGITVTEVLHESPFLYTVKVAVDNNAEVRRALVGQGGQAALTVYRSVDKVTVSPNYAVSRIGGGGGHVEKVQGRFDALGWTLVEGEEVLLGVMPATWKVTPFNEEAKKNRDVHYAGSLDEAKGVFTPADAGPNKERSMMSNNIGNLAITATVKDGKKKLNGSGQLIVAVPVWTLPPIP
ncbi:MAG TPA: quinohemoprotein amine dehydrogenase subunit alpha [Alcanivoracaceae bacterium]|nr:quinohemoprotein amine dehydrogenase subunit alpha [Alcanivoracaceae bacterium]